jgi:drug/metabolite transporter (DMT)-like permease
VNRGIALGTAASLLSAATALIVSRAGGVNPLWLLLAQYLVGAAFSKPGRPAAPRRLHALRLGAGLWAFGGYYLALSLPGSRAEDMSMLINTAPVFATFWTTPDRRARLGAVLAFAGVAAALGSGGLAGLSKAHALALSAAAAYTVSIIVLGRLAEAGEPPATTNGFYNRAAGACVLLALGAARPGAPAHWWPVLAVGVIAAARIHILTVAAVDPAQSARVSVLSNLAFVWLAAAAAAQGAPQRWPALAVVVAGVLLASLKGTSRLSLRSARPMRAIALELNSRQSASIPSEKMTPFCGMYETSSSSRPGWMMPKTRRAAETLLTNGSRTVK